MLPTITLPKINTGRFDFGTQSQASAKVPPTWQARIRAMFKNYIWNEFSQPHIELWEWENAITLESNPDPFIAIWPRGRGKSTNGEMAAVDLGARDVRNYCLYVSETQDQADKHVETIRIMMESAEIAKYFPKIGKPKISKHGNKSWQRKRLTTENGYTVEAVGLDKAVRGHKIDWARPDLMVFDDIDNKDDKETAVKKKEDTITKSILPAGSPNCAVLFLQNLIHRDSIATKLSRKPGEKDAADWLVNRIVSGPHQAVAGLKYEMKVSSNGRIKWKITKGTSLWKGWTNKDCEAELTRYGPRSFESESQHNIDADNPNALLSSEIMNATRVTSHPDLHKIYVGVDPAGGAGQCGIVAVGVARIGRQNHGYTIADFSTPLGTSSGEWGKEVLKCYHALKADAIVGEKNFGGDMVENTVRTAVIEDNMGNVILEGKHVPYIDVSASRGKEVRAQPVAALFERGIMHHVGHFPELQRQWTSWKPGTKPSPDRLDAEVWAVTQLGLIGANELTLPEPQQGRFADINKTTGRKLSRWK